MQGSMKGGLRFFELVLVQRSLRYFLIGSQPNDDIRTLSLGGVLSPSIPGLASYLTSFSVPTGRDVIVKSVS